MELKFSLKSFGKSGRKFVSICLAIMLIFSSMLVPMTASAKDDFFVAPNSSVTDGNTTDGNVTSGNVTDGNVTAGDAIDGGTGNLRWSFSFYTGCLEITGEGRMPNWSYDTTAPWNDYRFEIEKVIIGNGVENIGDFAFFGCFSLASVEIPASVTSIGNRAFYDCYYLKNIIIDEDNEYYSADDYGVLFNKDKTTLVQYHASNTSSYKIPDTVTSIGDYAFYECGSIVDIMIPVSVTQIGDYAFCGCDNLANVYYNGNDADWKKIVIGSDNLCLSDADIHYGWEYSGTCGENLTWTIDLGTGTLNITGAGSMTNWYYDTTAPWKDYRFEIEKVIIGNGVENIGDFAFSNCESLKSVTFGNSVTSIGKFAFAYCHCLKSVTIGNSVTSIGDHAFCDCCSLTSITIPNSVTSIGGGAFYYCTSLTSITIPNSVTTIGDSAFCDCFNLTSITIPDSVTSIGGGAFFDCYSLTSITIPDSVTSIEVYTFYYCESLTNITIPDSVTSIGDDAFYRCTSLTSINVKENNEYYSSDEYGVLFNKDKTILIQYPIGNKRTSYTIPDSVTSIEDYAFAYCDNLTSVTIGNSVTSIGKSAFDGCYNLTSVTIPNSVTSIGNRAFSSCDSLTSITIGNSVTSIGNYAFSSCDSLTSVTIPDSVTSIGDSAFDWCDSLSHVLYTGTEEQWSSLTVFEGNDNLENAMRHCNATGNEVITTDEQPTCTTGGYTDKLMCTICDEFLNEGRYISALGHNYENGLCNNCGCEFSADIGVGETISVQIDSYSITYLAYIPKVSGIYRFYSSSSSDTYGYLFDANKNQLTYNDDGGNGYNFSITYELQGGMTYYWGARFYNQSNSGSFNVTLI